MSKKDKCSKTQKNRIVIHKGSEEKRIYKNLLGEYIDNGWILGQSEKHRESNSKKHLEKIPWNKDTKGLTKANESSFKKGNEPWNKGKGKMLGDDEIDSLVDLYSKNISLKDCCKNLKIQFFTAYKYFKDNNLLRSKAECKLNHETPLAAREKISKANKGHIVSEKTRIAVSKANKSRTKEQIRIQVSKSWLTKKLNNTFNTSKLETELYKKLLKENVNKTIYKQYKDPERYPYYCDFYIKEDDLFIELNAHWTHGGHPFNPNDLNDIEKLNIWKEKAKTSKFYKQAIYIWTDLDVRKQKCAKDNNLNYKVIY